MKIINYIHIGDEIKNLDDMSSEEKQEIAKALNAQALKFLGYEMHTNDKGDSDIGKKNGERKK